MPKIGIIYNDIKPIACKTAHQIQDQLLSLGCQVFMATGSGGLLGHS
jgi:NAD+ kinase